MDALELRVVEVKSALDVGLAEIKGALNVLVQAGEYTKAEFARRDAERVADLAAQEKKDADQETRIRALEKHVYKVAGAGAAGSVLVAGATGVAMHFWK